MKDAFKALSDPTRRAILDLLRKRSHTSGEIAEHFGSSWPTISRHLGILKDAGLIRVERDGQFMRYELHTTVFQDVAEQVAAWLNTSPKKKNA
ncbi:MAG: autorepressor SdpR family transcription factor [Gemmatimonadaceae bacterium]